MLIIKDSTDTFLTIHLYYLTSYIRFSVCTYNLLYSATLLCCHIDLIVRALTQHEFETRQRLAVPLR